MSQIFLNATANKPPNKLLIECMDLINIPHKGNALDLGGGAGNDALFLQSRGYAVDIIDKNSKVGEFVNNREVNFINSSFEECTIAENYYDFVNAQWSLSFCSPENFNEFWTKVVSGLKNGGYFCGNFFGTKDEWSSDKSKTFFDSESVSKLFENFEVIKESEREWDGTTAVGDTKHWHVFNYIAKKI